MTYLRLGVAVGSELGSLAEQTAAEPGSMSLSLVTNNLDIHSAATGTAAALLAGLDSGIDKQLNVSL